MDEGLELYPGALAGYRAFRLFCGRLYSLTKHSGLVGLGNGHYEYTLETNEASCPYGHTRAPHGGCSCGFWMYKDLEGVLAEPLAYPYHDDAYHSQLIDVPTVLMLVAGWGKVVEDEIGFRTEYLRSLAMVETSSEVPEASYGTHRYAFSSYDIGLPVTDPDGLPALVEDYGLTVLEREEAEPEPGSLSALVSANVFRPPPAPLPAGGAWASLWGMAPAGSTASPAPAQTAFDKMLKAMAGVVDSFNSFKLKLPRYKNSTRCCENNQEHERAGKWCRQVFSMFFIAVEDEGGLSLEEYRESFERGLNRRPVLPGYMRQKGRG